MKHFLTYGPICGCSKALAAALVAVSLPAQAEQVDIYALGDSLTQGYGLMDQEGLVPQLRAWLTERGHEVRLVNGGVSGDTTAGGLARMDWALTPEIDAMIVALGGNDLLRGIDPAASRANLDGILQKAQAADIEVLLVGMSAPGNYGPDYKAAFDAMYPDLAETYGALHMADFFEGLRGETDDPGAFGAFMQPDGIHPNGAGVARIVEALGPRVEELIERAKDSGL